MQLVTEDSSVIGLIEEPTNRIDFYEVKLFEDGLIHVGNPTSPYWITREWDYSLHELSQVYWNLHHLKFNEIATNNLSFLFKLVANDIGQTLTSKKPSIVCQKYNGKKHLWLVTSHLFQKKTL